MAAIAPICNFGWKPTNATLPGVDGATHDVLAHTGDKGLVVVFICNHCPYVKGIIDRIVRTADDLRAIGVGFVAISSNDANTYPEDSFDKMKLFAEAHGFTFPYLYDEDQSVARTWDAVCTPDFFGFNTDMELQYRGRLDAAHRQAEAGDARRDLFEAMKQIAETGKGPEEQIGSMGCSIKWKDAA